MHCQPILFRLMPKKVLIAVAAIFSVFQFIATARAADAVVVSHWPNDVPCSALVKNADGSWTVGKVILLPRNTSVGNNTFKNTPETSIFERKCGATAKR